MKEISTFYKICFSKAVYDCILKSKSEKEDLKILKNSIKLFKILKKCGKK